MKQNKLMMAKEVIPICYVAIWGLASNENNFFDSRQLVFLRRD